MRERDVIEGGGLALCVLGAASSDVREPHADKVLFASGCSLRLRFRRIGFRSTHRGRRTKRTYKRFLTDRSENARDNKAATHCRLQILTIRYC